MTGSRPRPAAGGPRGPIAGTGWTPRRAERVGRVDPVAAPTVVAWIDRAGRAPLVRAPRAPRLSPVGATVPATVPGRTAPTARRAPVAAPPTPPTLSGQRARTARRAPVAVPPAGRPARRTLPAAVPTTAHGRPCHRLCPAAATVPRVFAAAPTTTGHAHPRARHGCPAATATRNPARLTGTRPRPAAGPPPNPVAGTGWAPRRTGRVARALQVGCALRVGRVGPVAAPISAGQDRPRARRGRPRLPPCPATRWIADPGTRGTTAAAHP